MRADFQRSDSQPCRGVEVVAGVAVAARAAAAARAEL